MNPTTENQQSLYEIIEEIQANCVDFQWFVGIEEVIKALGISKETFYKTVYSYRNSNYDYKINKGFSEKDVEFLAILTNHFLGIQDSLELFTKSGIYIPEYRLLELREQFVKVLISVIRNHTLDKELLELLISSTLSFEDAFDSYFDSKFDLDLIIRRVVETYIEASSIDNSYGVEEYLIGYIRKLLTYHKISFYKITEDFRDEYYYEMFGKHRDEASYYASDTDKEFLSLLGFFNLKTGCSFVQLKNRYKEMLKKFHPDINKDGLEKTKQIIANYKKLQSYFQ